VRAKAALVSTRVHLTTFDGSQHSQGVVLRDVLQRLNCQHFIAIAQCCVVFMFTIMQEIGLVSRLIARGDLVRLHETADAYNVLQMMLEFVNA
jgi:hypothetical protein